MYCYFAYNTVFNCRLYLGSKPWLRNASMMCWNLLPNFKKQKGPFAKTLEVDVNIVKIFSFTVGTFFSQVKKSSSCVDILG